MSASTLDSIRKLLIQLYKLSGNLDFEHNIESQQLAIESIHEYNLLVSGNDRSKLIRIEDLKGEQSGI